MSFFEYQIEALLQLHKDVKFEILCSQEINNHPVLEIALKIRYAADE